MSLRSASTSKQGVVMLAVLLAWACAEQTQSDDDAVVPIPESGGVGGANAGMPGSGGTSDPMGSGGSIAGMPGTGGASTGSTGGGGSAGRGTGGGAGTGGSNAGRGGTGAAGRGGSGGTGTGGSAGTVGLGGRGGSGGTGAGGQGAAGAGSTGGTSGGTGAGGRFGSGGMTGMAGTGTAGTGTAGTGTAGGSGMSCVTSLKPSTDSGMLGTGQVCFDVTGTMMGWQVSNAGSRVITVNGAVVDVTKTPLAVPALVDGHRIFVFGAGTPAYTSWGYW